MIGNYELCQCCPECADKIQRMEAQLEAVRQGAERFLRYLRTIEKRGPQTPHEREVRGFALSILGATDRALAATEGGGDE